MTTPATRTEAPRGLHVLRGQSGILAVFTGAVFMSALLVFSVQPIFAKMVLPKLGGSSSVWAVSMCFFQGVLLAGYCYAHLLNRYLPAQRGLMVHLSLLAAAALALPFGLPAGAEPPAGDAYFWLIGILGLGVGLPYFAVSANAPLLQAWFAGTGHPHAKDPYFLYGASNLGSLIALLAYPIAVEPMWGLVTQSQIWSGGFALLAVLITVSGLTVAMAASTGEHKPLASAGDADLSPVSWGDRAAWIGLAFVPSGLLVAFSTYLATDVASAPLLWVVPLAMFLATFVLVFRDKPIISHRAMLIVQPTMVSLTLAGLALLGGFGLLLTLLGGVAAFFTTTMIAHRQLYERRPQAHHLTEFYLWMSFGGLLGGVSAAIVAPQIFNTLSEFPLLLLLGMLCRPGLVAGLALRVERDATIRIAIIGLVAMLAAAGAVRFNWLGDPLATRVAFFYIAAFGLLAILSRERPLHQLLAVALASLSLVVLPSAMHRGEPERSFYGVHRITHKPIFAADGSNAGEVRILIHGTTVHGVERTKGAGGQPIIGAPTTTGYYHPSSPMYFALDAARRAVTPGDARAFKVGIVGLGAGTMSCHARAGERWTVFELDPVVIKIAQTRFSFLKHCLPDAEIILGDARLTLAKQPAQTFDYLLIDAFSSDAIPVHLLTREAITLYLDKLSARGVLALHISNRHLDLAAVTASLVAAIPGLHAVHVFDRRQNTIDVSSSTIVALARSPDVLAPILALQGAEPSALSGMATWTDDYSNILSAMLRKYWR